MHVDLTVCAHACMYEAGSDTHRRDRAQRHKICGEGMFGEYGRCALGGARIAAPKGSCSAARREAGRFDLQPHPIPDTITSPFFGAKHSGVSD